MLKFIIGVSGTGKTFEILNSIKNHAIKNEKCILIVPEQFSSTAETMVYNKLKDTLSANVNVFSFTSFAEFILKQYGGISTKTLSDAARVVIVRRAINSLADKLNLYQTQKNNIGFCKMCAHTINELKTAGADVNTLYNISNNEKLNEIALIYSAYEGLIKGVALDPQDRITLALNVLENSFFENYNFYIEGFEGFTAPQFNMLKRIIENTNCTISLCTNTLNETNGGYGLFSSVINAAQRLKHIAQKNNIKIIAPEILNIDYRHKNSTVLKELNLFLCNNENYVISDNILKNNDITLNLQKNIYDECKTVSVEISKLIKTSVKYSEIAIICRDIEKYIKPLKYELNLMQIPFFTDVNTTIEHTNIANFFKFALQIAIYGISSELILRIIKTDICGFEPQQIIALENYAYTWQLKNSDWQKPFYKNPSGFADANLALKKEDVITLNYAEEIRSKIIPVLNEFISQIKNKDENNLTALNISKALFSLLQKLNCEEHILNSALYLGLGKPIKHNDDILNKNNIGEEIFATYNIIIGILDEISDIFGDEIISVKEYDEVFLILLQSQDIGHVPQTDNAIIITSADRMRLQNPKYCFVMGINEGEFPKTVGFSGLLTHADRDELIKNGINMPGGFENRTLLEQMFFYKALTSCSNGLYLSALSPEYGGGEVSVQLEQIMQIFNPVQLTHNVNDIAFTPNSALDYLSQNYTNDTSQTTSIINALQDDENFAKSIEIMQDVSNFKHYEAKDKKAVKQILGNEIYISPTRIEQFNKCKFAYFAKYVLNISPVKKAELSPLESGNLVHYVLENVLKQAGDNFENLTKQQLKSLANDVTKNYVQQFMPENSTRFSYIIDRLNEGIIRLLFFLQEEQQQSQFKPIALEQEIGTSENAVEPFKIQTSTGEIVNVIGKIDRVDVMHTHSGDYLRVIDYKTGTKKFNLADVYCGLDTQMLFYLFILCKTKHALYNEHKPAGVLYVMADPAPQNESRKHAQDPLIYKTDGLILDNDFIIKGMDKNLSGVFVPFSFNKNGEVKTKSKIASEQKLKNIEEHLTKTVLLMAQCLYEGDIEAVPLRTKDKSPCTYCEYRPICNHEDGIRENYITAPKDVFC